MFRLEKTVRFEAAHRLPQHDGACERLHGHSFRAMLILEGDDLVIGGPKNGMLIDYGDVSAAVKPLLDHHLDHHFLNDTVVSNPTSENIARWMFGRLKSALPLLVAVRIEETCTAACEYRP